MNGMKNTESLFVMLKIGESNTPTSFLFYPIP